MPVAGSVINVILKAIFLQAQFCCLVYSLLFSEIWVLMCGVFFLKESFQLSLRGGGERSSGPKVVNSESHFLGKLMHVY